MNKLDAIEGITFKADKMDFNPIYVAAIRYLLNKLGEKKDELPAEIDVTDWLPK